METDVLIIGSGPAGGSAALFLSKYGVKNMVLTKYRWTAHTPRAHITNQRTMEILRDMGIEAEEVSVRTGVGITCFAIGPGREVLDLYGDWAR